MPGKALLARGAKLDDEEAYYRVSIRIAFFLPYENGLMTGKTHTATRVVPRPTRSLAR